jgi:hypothetical protein
VRTPSTGAVPPLNSPVAPRSLFALVSLGLYSLHSFIFLATALSPCVLYFSAGVTNRPSTEAAASTRDKTPFGERKQLAAPCSKHVDDGCDDASATISAPASFIEKRVGHAEVKPAAASTARTKQGASRSGICSASSSRCIGTQSILVQLPNCGVLSHVVHWHIGTSHLFFARFLTFASDATASPTPRIK